MTLEEMNSFLDEIGEEIYCKIFLKDIPEGILNAVKNEDGSV